MATYITLLKYTEQGLKTIKESPSRLEKAKQLLKSLGGELKSFHLVQGRYDAIVISEAPNDEAATKSALWATFAPRRCARSPRASTARSSPRCREAGLSNPARIKARPHRTPEPRQSSCGGAASSSTAEGTYAPPLSCAGAPSRPARRAWT